MKKKVFGTVFAITALGWMGFIFSNSAKSRVASSAQSAPFEKFLMPFLAKLGIEDTKYAAELIVRKGAHITEFFVLTVTVSVVLYLFGKSAKESAVLSALFGVCVAIADEVIQIFSNRGAKVSDVFIDSVGVLLAAILFLLICKIIFKEKY